MASLTGPDKKAIYLALLYTDNDKRQNLPQGWNLPLHSSLICLRTLFLPYSTSLILEAFGKCIIIYALYSHSRNIYMLCWSLFSQSVQLVFCLNTVISDPGKKPFANFDMNILFFKENVSQILIIWIIHNNFWSFCELLFFVLFSWKKI